MTLPNWVQTPRILLATIIWASIVLTASADFTNCTPPPAGLVSWWRGEGNALDQVGGNSGVLLNGAGFDAGVVGQAFSFNGTNSYVEVPNSPSLRLTNELTIEFWVKRQDLQAEDYIVNKGGDYTRGALNYGVVIDRSPANTLGFDFAGGYRLAGSIADLSWHHIGIVARHGDVDPTFYVDGVQRPVTSRYGASTIDLYASTEPLHIGAQVDLLSGWSYYSGARVDELSIFNRALAAAEIQAIYRAGSAGKCAVGVAPTIFAQPVSQAVAVGANVTFSVTAAGTVPLSYQWQFNSTNIAGATASSLTLTNVQPGQGGTYLVIVSNALGTVPSSNAVLAVIPAALCATPPAGLVSWWPGEGNANDIAGINNGTLLNGATFALGKVGQAFSFDGASSYIQIADNPNLHFTNSLTIEAWIYPTSTAGYHNIVSKWDWDYAGAQMSFTTALNPGGRLGFGVCDNGNCPSGSGNVSAASLLPVNQWAHFAATYDGSYVAIYLNGVLENQVPYQNGIFPGTGPLIIGAAAAGGGQVISPFAGLIDEPAVYNRALSAAEIQAIYNAGSAGKCSSGVAPSVITQPVSQAVAVGANVTFSVTAAGTVPLSYQWSFDGSALAGATNASLTLAGVSTNQSGLYAVWVTNLYGAVLSSNASLAVRVMGTSLFDDFDPGIDLAQWSSFGGTVLATNYGGSVSGSNSLWFGGNGSRYAATVRLDTSNGGNVEFYLRIANGSGYPWELADLPGEGIVLEYSINGGTNWIEMGRYNTSAYFSWPPISVPIPAGAQANGAQFRWRQSSNSGASFDHWALDDVKILTGPAAPTIVAQPQNRVAVVGGAVTFSVAVTGTRPLSYQWSFNGSALGGATNESLTLTNLQISQTGSYGVVITNAGGAVSSSNAILSVNFPAAAMRVISVTNAPSGATVNVPVSLAANGNENALSFSLDFDPAKLTYVSTVTGSGAIGATLLLNTAQATSGKLGAILALPPGTTFAAGTQELVQVTFTAVLLTNAVSTTVSFGDVPIVRQLSDAPGNVLAATYAGGAVTIQAADFEGDLSPRPNGDKAVLVTDWVMAGRYAARLDYPTNAAEFQRADCAPRATLGDGAITVSDWVQVGRYAAGLDPLTAAGGSTSEVTQTGNISKKDRPEITPKDHQPLSRLLEVADTMLIQGLAGTVSVQLQSQGNENAVGFSLSFDPAVLNYVSASLGSDSKGATLFVNASQAGAGRLGFVLAQGTGSSFVAGTRELVKVTFLSTAADQGKSTISLASQPVPCEVSDTTALRLAASYVNGTITVNPLPSLSIARSGENLTLAWPLWATNFGLQTAEGGLSPAVPWTNLAVVPVLTSNETVVTLPLVGTNKLFRLHQP